MTSFDIYNNLWHLQEFTVSCGILRLSRAFYNIPWHSIAPYGILVTIFCGILWHSKFIPCEFVPLTRCLPDSPRSHILPQDPPSNLFLSKVHDLSWSEVFQHGPLESPGHSGILIWASKLEETISSNGPLLGVLCSQRNPSLLSRCYQTLPINGSFIQERASPRQSVKLNHTRYLKNSDLWG